MTARARVFAQRAFLTAGLCGAVAACTSTPGPFPPDLFARLTPQEPSGVETLAFAAPPAAAAEHQNSIVNAVLLPPAPHQVGARSAKAPLSEVGMASWYGAGFHGRPTANGETFDRMALSAAHMSMPLPSYVRVTNLDNNRSIIVRVNDRGPYVQNRLIDVSEHTAELLNFRRHGLTKVRVDYLARAPLNADDDAMLLASYRAPSRSPTTLAAARLSPTRVAFAESDQAGRDGDKAMSLLVKPSKVIDRILMAFDAAGTAED